MDLFQALHTISSEVTLNGQSDRDLLHRVKHAPDFAATAKPLSPAVGLEDGVTLRPYQALHQLSKATMPRYQDDLFDRYVQWGLLRYLGLFDLSWHGDPLPSLAMSEAGKRIRGNQRRVTSEEMGIGFGVLLATRWFQQALGSAVSISPVDVDVGLGEGYIVVAGSRYVIGSAGGRRPDYLIVANDPAVRSRYRVRLLECKGTRSASTAIGQLAKAADQLGGITVDGRVCPGLAVSTITADSRVWYRAIDPEDDEEASYEVNSNTIERVADFRLSDEGIANVPAVDLANASVRASWATLADFGGNFQAWERWAPAVMRRRLGRAPRNRITFETPFGTARGTSVTFTFDGQRLDVRYAIDEVVDQQLSQSPAESIIEAQVAFAQRLAASEAPAQQSGQYDLYSATSDGSIFSLSAQ
jgi:hypothetical protein